MTVESSTSELIRNLRGAKESIDPWRPLAVLRESERTLEGGLVSTVTVFLAGAECPFSCSFCDLWRRTLDGPTPPGALPAQIEAALSEIDEIPRDARLKLYNASNFFESRAVPAVDLPRIAELAAPFERLVVECHPLLIDRRVVEFAARLGPRLEVAMGLETVHPAVLPSLNKEMSLKDFDRAAATLVANDILLRAFVLVAPPGLDPRDSIDWAVVSTAYALERGAETVTLIPVRGGNGELERLGERGSFNEPSLAVVEAAFERCSDLAGGVVLLDLWDLERFARCATCRGARRERLEQMNTSGCRLPEVHCELCADA